jgi:hypothetical protein
MRILFGVANVFVNPTTGNIPLKPTNQQLITLQDFAIDIDVTVKDLRGQFQFPDDTADADRKITWKSGFGRMDIDAWNNVVFGEESITSGGEDVNVNEQHTVPASTPFTITVTNSANFVKDEGAIYASGTAAQIGQKLQNNGLSSPSTGQYINSVGGVYTFAAADAGLVVNISYISTVTSGRGLLVSNHTQGWGPGLEIYAANPYQEFTAGIPNYVHLYACKVTKTGMPLKRADYMITTLEGEAYADSSGRVAYFYED